MATESRSSPRERTRAAGLAPERGVRGQAEPIAAIAAVLAVCLGIALYAGVAAEAPDEAERSLAEPTLERVDDRAVTDGVVDPTALPAPETVAPGGHDARLTLRYAGRERRLGSQPPPDADRATRPVSVRVRSGERRPGRLIVEVWS